MQTGVVDGSENTPSNIFTQRVNEVQKHATVSNHGYIGYAVIVNKAFWDGLPEDVRAELDRAMDEATDFANGIAEKDNADALQAIRDAGTTEVHDQTPDERAAWVEALSPVQAEMEGRIGKDTVEMVRAAASAP